MQVPGSHHTHAPLTKEEGARHKQLPALLYTQLQMRERSKIRFGTTRGSHDTVIVGLVVEDKDVADALKFADVLPHALAQ
jgi:hypothetical protein